MGVIHILSLSYNVASVSALETIVRIETIVHRPIWPVLLGPFRRHCGYDRLNLFQSSTESRLLSRWMCVNTNSVIIYNCVTIIFLYSVHQFDTRSRHMNLPLWCFSVWYSRWTSLFAFTQQISFQEIFQEYMRYVEKQNKNITFF